MLMDFIHFNWMFHVFCRHLHGKTSLEICENPLISWAAQHARYVSPPPQPAPSRRAAFLALDHLVEKLDLMWLKVVCLPFPNG